MCFARIFSRRRTSFDSSLQQIITSQSFSSADKQFVEDNLIDRKKLRLKSVFHNKQTILHFVCIHAPGCLTNLMNVLYGDKDLGRPKMLHEVLRLDATTHVSTRPINAIVRYFGNIIETPGHVALLMNKDVFKALYAIESKGDLSWTFMHYVARFSSDDNYKAIMQYIADLDLNIFAKMLVTDKKPSNESWDYYTSPLDITYKRDSSEAIQWLTSFIAEKNIPVCLPSRESYQTVPSI